MDPAGAATFCGADAAAAAAGDPAVGRAIPAVGAQVQVLFDALYVGEVVPKPENDAAINGLEMPGAEFFFVRFEDSELWKLVVGKHRYQELPAAARAPPDVRTAAQEPVVLRPQPAAAAGPASAPAADKPVPRSPLEIAAEEAGTAGAPVTATGQYITAQRTTAEIPRERVVSPPELAAGSSGEDSPPPMAPCPGHLMPSPQQPPPPSQATAAATLRQLTETAGHALIGRRCEVFWDGDAVWYAGTITDYDSGTQHHLVQYEASSQQEAADGPECVSSSPFSTTRIVSE